MSLPPGFLAIGPIAHRAALVGRVIDKLGQGPLPGVSVEITDSPPAYRTWLATLRQGRPGARPDRIATDGDGRFRWIDLPAGSYTLRASAPDPRYADATATASVVVNAAASVEIALDPTALAGRVNADNPAGPLAMVRVRMRDSGEVTFTAGDGSFTLSPVEPGATRVIELSAQRYVTVTRTVSLQRGQTTTVPTIILSHS